MKVRYTLLFATLLGASPIAAAKDGKALYEQNCQGCHGTEVFTRKDRRIKNKAALAAQVQRCNFALEKKLFDEDMAAITNYLNQQFYKF